MTHNDIDYRFLDQGLHCTPDVLRTKLQQAIDEVPASPVYDAVLIGYGLCSNGIEGVVARDKPLVVMRGHDCITFLLGSKEKYREYFDSHPGTYWYSPGWIDTGGQPSKERYELTLQYYIDKYGQDNAEYLMEMEQGWFKNYNNAAYVDFGFVNSEEYKEYTKRSADWLKWGCDILTGDPNLIKDFFDGNWDNERFLVVQPGKTIVASHDDKILTAK
jgi:hypothetical protein